MLYIHRKNDFYTCYLEELGVNQQQIFPTCSILIVPLSIGLNFLSYRFSIDIAYDNYDILVRDCPNKHGNFVNKHIRFYE